MLKGASGVAHMNLGDRISLLVPRRPASANGPAAGSADVNHPHSSCLGTHADRV